MSDTPQDQAALQEFWNSTLPMSQVRENLNPPNGQYDLLITRLEPKIDDNGMVFIDTEFTITAPASIASAKVGNTFRPRLYVGTKKDKLAQQPETRLNSPGLSALKGIARVCQVPNNDQPAAQLCAALLSKQFSNRIETKKVTKKNAEGVEETKEYCNFGRNPSPLGTIPARLDSEAAGVTAAPVAQNGAASTVPAGAFDNE